MAQVTPQGETLDADRLFARLGAALRSLKSGGKGCIDLEYES